VGQEIHKITRCKPLDAVDSQAYTALTCIDVHSVSIPNLGCGSGTGNSGIQRRA
jgi:hypothetical protein